MANVSSSRRAASSYHSIPSHPLRLPARLIHGNDGARCASAIILAGLDTTSYANGNFPDQHSAAFATLQHACRSHNPPSSLKWRAPESFYSRRFRGRVASHGHATASAVQTLVAAELDDGRDDSPVAGWPSTSGRGRHVSRHPRPECPVMERLVHGFGAAFVCATIRHVPCHYPSTLWQIAWVRRGIGECPERERSDLLCQEKPCRGADEVHRGR
jgi:hypothetical protein